MTSGGGALLCRTCGMGYKGGAVCAVCGSSSWVDAPPPAAAARAGTVAADLRAARITIFEGPADPAGAELRTFRRRCLVCGLPIEPGGAVTVRLPLAASSLVPAMICAACIGYAGRKLGRVW